MPIHIQVTKTSLLSRFYTYAFADRDCTIGEGFFINDVNYEVHRFHPPSIYGRRGTPEDGEGIALTRFRPTNAAADETHWFMLITYRLPVLSSKAVPEMIEFIERNKLGRVE